MKSEEIILLTIMLTLFLLDFEVMKVHPWVTVKINIG